MKSFKQGNHRILIAFSRINNAYFIYHEIGGQQYPPEIFNHKDAAQQRYREKVEFLKEVAA